MLLRAMNRLVSVYQSMGPGRPVRSELGNQDDDCVVLSYTRLTQRVLGGEAITASCCETRIWQRQAGQWRQVHVHRS